MKVSELEGMELDFWVARAEVLRFVMRGDQPAFEYDFDPEGPATEFAPDQRKMWLHYRPHADWSQGGPIVEREGINIARKPNAEWMACHSKNARTIQSGPTALVAAMRAFVASKFSDEQLPRIPR